MKNYLSLTLISLGIFIQAQTATSVTNLQAPNLDETSGLLVYNAAIITFNDSGGAASLFELDPANGNITRTVAVNNASNVDWEDIAQDATYIYIGDIGNNSGNRTDLKVYRIAKSDYDDGDDQVDAEEIAYSYANQTDFTPNFNNNNWDAEGLISYGNQLLIFSKNWTDNTADVYAIPKTTGTHSASLVSSFNTNGLITAADTSLAEDFIYLTGYTTTQAPFMYVIQDIPNGSLDVFAGDVSEKISGIVSLGNQVEAVALIEITPNNHRLYITNEQFTFSNIITINFPARLWTIELDVASLSTQVRLPEQKDLHAFPNPFTDSIRFTQQVDAITVYDTSGKRVAKGTNLNQLSLAHLPSGIYFAKIKQGETLFTERLIKR